MKVSVSYINSFLKDSTGNPTRETIGTARILHKIDDDTYIAQKFEQCYNYVVKGVLVTQRCGASKELLEKLLETNCQAGDYELQHKIYKELKGEEG